MKKHLNLLLAALLGLSILGVPACGGSDSTDGTIEEPAAEKAEQPEEVVDPAKDFYGEWQLAAVETQGLTMVGDSSSLIGTTDTMRINIEEGGKARVSFDGESYDSTWELKSETTIVVKTPDVPDGADDTADDADDEGAVEGAEDAVESIADEGSDVEFDLEDGVLTAATSSGDSEGKLYFSTDGALADYPAIDPATITAADSADSVVGDWTLVGMCLMGATIYGDADAMAGMIGEGNETIVISGDGTVEMMGGTVAFATGDSGGYIDVNGQAQLPVGIRDEFMTVDFSKAVGQDAILLYKK